MPRRSAPRTLAHALAVLAATLVRLVTVLVSLAVAIVALALTVVTAATAKLGNRRPARAGALKVAPMAIPAPVPSPTPFAMDVSAQLTTGLVGMGFAPAAVRRYVGQLGPAALRRPMPALITDGLRQLAS
jgi:hypothetical protein